MINYFDLISLRRGFYYIYIFGFNIYEKLFNNNHIYQLKLNYFIIPIKYFKKLNNRDVYPIIPSFIILRSIAPTAFQLIF